MSVENIFEELTRLQEDVDSAYERFDRDSSKTGYYLLDASYLEEDYWIKVFRGIKARAEVLSNLWEAEVLLLKVMEGEPPLESDAG